MSASLSRPGSSLVPRDDDIIKVAKTHSSFSPVPSRSKLSLAAVVMEDEHATDLATTTTDTHVYATDRGLTSVFAVEGGGGDAEPLSRISALPDGDSWVDKIKARTIRVPAFVCGSPETGSQTWSASLMLDLCKFIRLSVEGSAVASWGDVLSNYSPSVSSFARASILSSSFTARKYIDINPVLAGAGPRQLGRTNLLPGQELLTAWASARISRRWYGAAAIYALITPSRKRCGDDAFIRSVRTACVSGVVNAVRAMLNNEKDIVLSLVCLRFEKSDTVYPVPIPSFTIECSKPHVLRHLRCAAQALVLISRASIPTAALLFDQNAARAKPQSESQRAAQPIEVASRHISPAERAARAVLGGTGGLPMDLIRDPLFQLWENDERLWKMLRAGMASQFYPSNPCSTLEVTTDFLMWWRSMSAREHDAILPADSPNRTELEHDITTDGLDLNKRYMNVIRLVLFDRWFENIPCLESRENIKNASLVFAKIWFIYIFIFIAQAAGRFLVGAKNSAATSNSDTLFEDIFSLGVTEADEKDPSTDVTLARQLIRVYCNPQRVSKFLKIAGVTISAVVRFRSSENARATRQIRNEVKRQKPDDPKSKLFFVESDDDDDDDAQ